MLTWEKGKEAQTTVLGRADEQKWKWNFMSVISLSPHISSSGSHILIPMLQLRKLRSNAVKWHSLGHTAKDAEQNLRSQPQGFPFTVSSLIIQARTPRFHYRPFHNLLHISKAQISHCDGSVLPFGARVFASLLKPKCNVETASLILSFQTEFGPLQFPFHMLNLMWLLLATCEISTGVKTLLVEGMTITISHKALGSIPRHCMNRTG